MSEKSGGGTPITLDGISKWQGMVVGIVAGAFVAGGTYFAAQSNIARATEKAELATQKLVAVEQKVSKVEQLEARQAELDRKLDKILNGVQSMDRKLFALVCSKDPAKCDDYRPAIP